MRINRALLFCTLSLILHAAWLGLFLNSKKAPKPEPIEIEFLAQAPSSQDMTSKRIVNKARRSQGTSPPAHAEQIFKEGFQLNMSTAGSNPTGYTIFGEKATAGQITGSGAWVEQVDFEKGLELTAFWQKLKAKLDNGLEYPEDMAVQRLHGNVRADFFVDRTGRIIGDFHSVRGPRTLLNLYVMSALLVLLKEPFPEAVWADQDKLAVTVHVNFSTYGMMENRFSNQSQFQNNEITLLRSRYVKPLIVKNIEKVFTRYMPPIIPVPGGFYVDIPLLIQYVQNINTPDPDDLRERRLGVTRAQLELALKKKQVL